MDKIDVFTDGCCICNGSPDAIGGWGYVIIDEVHEFEAYGGESNTTNNRMEIQAVLEALKIIEQPSEIHVHSDSKYVVNSISDWLHMWKREGKEMANMDLWDDIYELINFHKVKMHWVKGHNGDVYNELADELANKGMKEHIEQEIESRINQMQ